MEILKTFFGMRDDGVWQIDNLQSLPLRPNDDEKGDFYKVKDDLVVIQPASAGTVKSIMGQSIVPVVANVTGDNTLKCIGTGFFVSCTGLLITAAHVITDPIEAKYGDVLERDDLSWHARKLNFGVMVAANPIFEIPGFRFRRFEWCVFLAERRPHPIPFRGIELKLSTDIAICKVESMGNGIPHQPLSIVPPKIRGSGMRASSTATVVGYAGMEDVTLSAGRGGAIFGDYKFDLHVSRGRILERFPDNLQTRAVATPGPCFSFSAKAAPGMSGSPIFDHERIYVHAVASKGFDLERNEAELGYGSMLAPSMHIPIPQMGGRTLAQIQASDDEGMPKIFAPDI